MNISRIINVFAGFMIMLGLGMAHWNGDINLMEASWLWLPLFVGFNLFQMGFTGFCPLAIILKKLGCKKTQCCSSSDKKTCC